MKFLQRFSPLEKIQVWTSLAAQVAPLIDPLPNSLATVKLYCSAFIPTLTENIRRTIIGAFSTLSCQNLTTLSLASDVPLGLFDDYTLLASSRYWKISVSKLGL